MDKDSRRTNKEIMVTTACIVGTVFATIFVISFIYGFISGLFGYYL